MKPFNGKDLTGWLTKGGKPQETLKVGTAKVDPNNPGGLVVEPGGCDLVNPLAHAKGLYGAQAPAVNASKAPGEWQKFVIDFQAPKFDASGKKVANAVFNKVTLNGKVIHENVEMKQQTPGGVTEKEAPLGPLMFQGNHGPVAYRNIKINSR